LPRTKTLNQVLKTRPVPRIVKLRAFEIHVGAGLGHELNELTGEPIHDGNAEGIVAVVGVAVLA